MGFKQMTSGIQWENEPDLENLYRAHGLLKSNPEQAFIALRWLADRGSIMSMIYIAHALENGAGIERDIAQAEHWYRRASEIGSPLAEHSLGQLFLDAQRFSEALTFFLLGVEKNYPPALRNAGSMYYRGNGVDIDLGLAEDYLTRATGFGNIFARRMLADLFLRHKKGATNEIWGGWLFVSAFFIFVIVYLRNPTSDRLR